MNAPKRLALLTGGTAVLSTALIVSLLTPTPGHGQNGPPTQDVVVVNSPAEAVPVALDEPVDVAIVNAPLVEVSNAPSSPVPVQVVSKPVCEPWRVEKGVVVDIGQDSAASVLDTVPAGKQIVIQHASAYGTLTSGRIPHFSVLVQGPGDFKPKLWHVLKLEQVGSYERNQQIRTEWRASHPLTMTVEENSSIWFQLILAPGPTVAGDSRSIGGNLSGYVVDK